MKTKYKVYLLATIFFTMDLVTKAIIINKGNVLLNIPIIENFFYITLVKNTGAAFSMLKGFTPILSIVAIIALIFIDRKYLNENLSKLEVISYSLLIGGIFGNLCDRIINGFVIDFLSFKIFNYYFPIFNMADIFIVIGAILLAINIIRSEINENRDKRRK